MELTTLDKEILLMSLGTFGSDDRNEYADAIRKLVDKIQHEEIVSIDGLVVHALYLVPALKKYNDSLARQVKDPILTKEEKEQPRKSLARCHWLWTTIQRAFDERLLICPDMPTYR